VGQFIYITGADGTGKTTRAQFLLQRLQYCNIRCNHLWLRFPFFFSLPLLAYARWRGYSWYEVCNGVRHGYWDFEHSLVLRTMFPWIFLLDATLAALLRVYLPLCFGATIVCERFVLDMLVDLAVALNNPAFHRDLPGLLYLRLLPPRSKTVILDLDGDTIRERRQDLQYDRRLDARLEMYRRLASDLSLPQMSGAGSLDQVVPRSWAIMGE
jgi:hypothetical protein